MMERRQVRRLTPVILAAVAVLLALDAVGELAGQPLGFPYPPLGAVTLLIYLSVGAIGSWRTNFAGGLLAATIVGLLAGTVGPLIAWLIGSGPVEQDITEPRIFAYRIAVVTAAAAAAGLVGAAAGSWLERRRGMRRSGIVPR
jgi:tetrahydromethanopterin S-methyltransferase subunit C